MPEEIPPAEHIKKVERRLKDATPIIEIEGPYASGLDGDRDTEGNKKSPSPERNR